MAQLANIGTTPILFRSRNGISYTSPVAGTTQVPDSDVTWDLVDSAIQAGNLTVTLDSGLPFFDGTGSAVTGYSRVEPLGYPVIARQLDATLTSASTQLTPTIRRISIKARYASIRYAIGQTPQVANASTSHFIESGERLDLSVPAGSYIAVIRDLAELADGKLCITELM